MLTYLQAHTTNYTYLLQDSETPCFGELWVAMEKGGAVIWVRWVRILQKAQVRGMLGREKGGFEGLVCTCEASLRCLKPQPKVAHADQSRKCLVRTSFTCDAEKWKKA